MVDIRLTPVALVIFIITVGLSLLTLYKKKNWLEKLMLIPYQVFKEKKYYQLLTSGFIHGSGSHLFFNMLTFYFFALPLEYFLGHGRFLFLYLGCMVLGDLSSLFKHRNNPEYKTLGASGALSGVLFSYILFNPKATLFVFPIPIPIPAPLFAAFYVFLSFYFSRRGQTYINHEAHLYGALSGLVLTFFLYPQLIIQKLQGLFY